MRFCGGAISIMVWCNGISLVSSTPSLNVTLGCVCVCMGQSHPAVAMAVAVAESRPPVQCRTGALALLG